MVRGAIDDNHLQTEFRPFLDEGYAHKELPMVHIIYIKGILFDT